MNMVAIAVSLKKVQTKIQLQTQVDALKNKKILQKKLKKIQKKLRRKNPNETFY